MRNYTCPPLHSHPRPNTCAWLQFKIQKINDICLPPPINQSTAALVSSVSPQSISDLDTDQGEIIDETIKQVAQSVNQMLLKTTTGNSTSNLSDPSQDRTLDRQSIPALNPGDIHTLTRMQNSYLQDQFHLKTAFYTQLKTFCTN